MFKFAFQNGSQVRQSIKNDLQRGLRRGVQLVAQRGAKLIGAKAGEKSKRIARGTKYLPESVITSTDHVTANVVSSAVVPGESATPAVLHLPNGKTRPVNLHGTRAVDIAPLVLGGTGQYGPHGRVIRPRNAGALTIPVKSVPAGESYISARGKKYIIRPFADGMPAFDYVTGPVNELEGLAGPIMIDAIAEKMR